VTERFFPVSFLNRETIVFLPSTAVGRMLYYGIGPILWIVVIVAALRPLRESPHHQQSGALTRIRSLLASGGDSMAFMASWPGNKYWFDPEQDLAVAYRVIGRIALTLGGPFGSFGPKDATIDRFARFCDENDWVPVYYSIDGEFQGKFRSMGWQSMVVAEEAVLRLNTWQTTGKKWQDVRTSINRAERAGITATWTRYAALSLGTATQLAEISEQWVADKDLPEMGFTLGGLDELRDPDVALMLAIDLDGQVQAVTSWLPTRREGLVIGWTLDFMRRRPGSMNGVMEFLIAEAATNMRDAGIEFLSLSGAPLAHTASLSEEASGIDRILAYLSSSLEPVYGFRSLLNFKRKFQPEFHPLLMAYPDLAALPAIGIALTRAYLPTLSLSQANKIMRGHPQAEKRRPGTG
jgi:phosphatidylglycerol lysyltransferase